MRMLIVALTLTLASLWAWADSPVNPPSILQITLSVVDDKLMYSLDNKSRDANELEKTLMRLRTLTKGEALTIVQIDFGKGAREVTASEFLAFLEVLQENGFTQISVYKPSRVGMILQRQPVVIEPIEKTQK